MIHRTFFAASLIVSHSICGSSAFADRCEKWIQEPGGVAWRMCFNESGDRYCKACLGRLCLGGVLKREGIWKDDDVVRNFCRANAEFLKGHPSASPGIEPVPEDASAVVISAVGETVSEQEVRDVHFQIQHEIVQLRMRFEEIKSSTQQGPDKVNEQLIPAGQIGWAMKIVLIIKPSQSIKLIGIPLAGVSDDIVLFDVSAWLKNGRPLNRYVLGDIIIGELQGVKMKHKEGARFIVDNVGYVCYRDASGIRFERQPDR
jgi:hypothetical protein